MQWVNETVFYHIYPIGLCGCPKTNDYGATESRLNGLYPWLEHLAGMGFNGLYIGPLFESHAHGYDTTDYYKVDRRLGTNEDLARFVARAHQLGVKVILDAVFNHVGRDFWAFKDLQLKREGSAYKDWFAKVDFSANNRSNDGFKYECWENHENLVNLNLNNEEVIQHIFGAVRQWVELYDIDGLRLDATNVMDKGFLSKLAEFSHGLKPNFWMMGEVTAGDYRQWANPSRLDSVTNYEAYKSLYSSFNDRNMFEMAWTLNRQFGAQGLCKDVTLYSFADNHDVTRVASQLKYLAHLLPLYTVMFSMPGVPSVYYGSEFCLTGDKRNGDHTLRPALRLEERARFDESLIEPLMKLIRAKKECRALQTGIYRQLHLTNEQLAFAREVEGDIAVTAVNAAEHAVTLQLTLPGGWSGRLRDILEPGRVYHADGGTLKVDLPANSARLLVR